MKLSEMIVTIDKIQTEFINRSYYRGKFFLEGTKIRDYNIIRFIQSFT